jgi:hypothetical protein
MIINTVHSSLPSQEPIVKTWHHDCSNTTGFEYMEIPTNYWWTYNYYSWTDTEADLESNGQSFLMPDFTNTSPVEFFYGPTYFYTLPDVFPLSGLRNFSVHMELNNTDAAYCGVVRVGLFGESFSPVLSVKIQDQSGERSSCECGWTYHIRNASIHEWYIGNEDVYHVYKEFSRPYPSFVNTTWSSWFASSDGLNATLPASDSWPAINRTMVPIEETETARDIKYVVLSFGGYYTYQYYPLPPFRVHDIYLEYEVGGIIDTTLPDLSSPPDIMYEVGQTGNTIQWNCSDDNPYRYWILDSEIPTLYFVDWATNKKEGLWNGSPYTQSVDGLEVGNRSFLLILQDKAGFMVWDEVIVMVTENPIVSFVRSNALVLGGVLFATAACIILYWISKKGKLSTSR